MVELEGKMLAIATSISDIISLSAIMTIYPEDSCLFSVHNFTDRWAGKESWSLLFIPFRCVKLFGKKKKRKKRRKYPLAVRVSTLV